MRDHAFTFPLPNGLHARPASQLSEQAAAFETTIAFHNDRNGTSANARSVLELVATNTQAGDPCRVTFDGADEDAAHEVLRRWIDDVLPGCDEPLSAAESGATGKIPRALRELKVERAIVGIPVSSGIGLGVAVVVGREEIPESAFPAKAESPSDESRHFHAVLAQLSSEYDAEISNAHSTDEREIVKAHRALLLDPALKRRVEARIAAGADAARATRDTIQDLVQELAGSESAYLRERVLDLRDVGDRLVRRLLGIEASDRIPALTAPSVIVADTLGPAEFLQLDRSLLRGLLIGDGGTTSHTVILAKSFGIPTLCGLGAAASCIGPGEEVVVDARAGVAVPEPSGAVRTHYERRLAHEERMAGIRRSWIQVEAATADNERIFLFANISSAEEAEAAFANGADGIGLFRTEMLFVGREAPSEDEQAAIYERTVRAAAGRPVTFRTLDVGGDKPVPGFTVAHEENPFLGRRGVRLYEKHADVVKTQLRAMLRAAAGAEGVKIMFPMIACVEEMRLCRELLAQAAEELTALGVEAGKVSAGMMLEVPAAAFAISELAEHAEFFSIGSNDLAQYFLAADRGDSSLAALHSPFHPSFIRLLRQIVEAARSADRPLGICGGIAGESEALALLVGLGIRQLSMAAPLIPGTKASLARLTLAACQESAQAALECPDEATARRAAVASRNDTPWIEPGLVLLDVEAESKPGAIRAMIDALESAGRTADADALEEAIWNREDAYATGFGNGFAIPHAKTDAVLSNSIVVARLTKPIDWGSIDDGPVSVILMMAVRDSQKDAHLRSLAKLSRLLMRDEFRERLAGDSSPDSLSAFLLESLG
mgnify:CR=1 FL=1|jgi:phosphoenolpyruvate-protein phosphotransferase